MELTNSSFKRSKWVEISDATQFGPRSNLVCDNVPLQLYICKLPMYLFWVDFTKKIKDRTLCQGPKMIWLFDNFYQTAN